MHWLAVSEKVHRSKIDWFEILAQTVTTDDRNLLMHRIMSMDVKGTFAYLYPRVFTLVCERSIWIISYKNVLFFSIRWKKEIFHHQWFVVHMNDSLKLELIFLVRVLSLFIDWFFIGWFSRKWSCDVYLAWKPSKSNICAIIIWSSISFTRPTRKSKKTKNLTLIFHISRNTSNHSVVLLILIIQYLKMFEHY